MNQVRIFAAAVILAGSCGSAAFAQGAAPAPAEISRGDLLVPPAGRTAQPIRFNIMFRIPLADTENGAEPDAAAFEAARKALYEQAGRECTTIKASFSDLDCSLASLNISVQTTSGPIRQPQTPAVTGNATYLLRPK